MLSRRKFLKTAALAAAVESGFGTPGQSQEPAQVQPVNLTVEYLTNPLGIDVRRPRLGWLLEGDQRSSKQEAYQIVAASRRDKLLAGDADLWNSGKVLSEDCVHVVYAGQELRSRMAVHWRLRTWDQKGRASGWSAPAFWEMGLLEKSDWQAKWIADLADRDREHTYTGPAPFFRKVFELSGPATSARAYICGLGFYELYLNGRKVGNHVLSPNQTDYDSRALRNLLYPFRDKTRKRVLYLTYDVTSYLRPGRNVAGIILGNGWYNQRDRLAEGYLWYHSPRVIFQMESKSSHGSNATVVSDETWKVSTSGPMIHDGIFTGEDYDARLEMNQWLEPDFDDSGWIQAEAVQPPKGTLEAQLSVPDRIIKTIQPISVTSPKPGTYRFDLGQNLTGWARLKVQGPRGRRVTMRFFEEMGPDYGQTDSYVLKGAGLEVYEPRFTWHGFREVEVNSAPGPMTRATLEGRVVHSDVEPAGKFECSNDLFNRILHNARWSQLSNMHCGVPSDCPHRERLGYTGDGQVDAESAMLNFDMAPFYTKWVKDMRDAQNSATGFVPHTVPFEGGGGGPPWGCAYVIVPWLMYLYYGDRRLLQETYSGMQRWVEYLKQSTDESGLVVREEPGSWCLGEWATPSAVKIPKPLVNTCYYAYVSQLMARIAHVLKRAEDAQHFAALAHSAKTAVNREFFKEPLSQYHDGRQGANVFPLAFGLVPQEHVKAVFNRLVEINLRDNKGHFDTGIYGTPLTLEVLTSGRRADVAYTLMNQTSFPSFGFEISQGATTLWEDWDGRGSHNHAMYASVIRWFYKALAGIAPDPEQPGFKNVLVRPYPLADLSYAQAEYRSIRGRIASHWRRKGGKLVLNLEIPAASTATVFLPADNPNKVRESGTSLQESRGLRLMGVKEARVVCAIGSGHYEFEVQDFNGLT
ncbi:MAG: glycoside hydrolase family 78 protein [Acidobacteria bacterium]|nr:glycoside hydrolase family 78 protein [Acidobacteriota bacterium]